MGISVSVQAMFFVKNDCSANNEKLIVCSVTCGKIVYS